MGITESGPKCRKLGTAWKCDMKRKSAAREMHLYSKGTARKAEWLRKWPCRRKASLKEKGSE